MSDIFYFLSAALIGYLLGSIPFGLIFVRLFKETDIRDIGSGRTGGTNAYRAGGWRCGLSTALGDYFKGSAAIWITGWLLSSRMDSSVLPWALAVAGIFSVVGHNWSIYIKFVGGAGTGPNVGWAGAHWFPIMPLSLLTAVVLFRFIGMASVVSLAVAMLIPITFLIRFVMGIDTTIAYTVGGFITFLIVTWALRPNIKRIVEGNERVVGPRSKRKESAN